MRYLYWLMETGKINADIPKVNMTILTFNALNAVYVIIGIVAVIAMIMAGYSWLTSNGQPEKSQKAMRTIIYCAIGLVVSMFAFAITNFVIGRTGQ